MSLLPLAAAADGVTVTVRLTPKARRAAIDGVALEPAPDGARPVLKVRVTAPPAEGQANAALIALLAEAWRLPKSAFTLAAGATQRVKRVHVRGDPATLLRAIAAKLGTG